LPYQWCAALDALADAELAAEADAMERLDPLETKLLDAVEVVDVDEDAAELEWLAMEALAVCVPEADPLNDPWKAVPLPADDSLGAINPICI